MKKFCTRCGHEFVAAGREVICPSCKQAAAEESKRAAVERAKAASWRGESVPVRISGRASTVIRMYATANGLPFAAALDALLKASSYFSSTGMAWDEVAPYKSRRRDKPQDKASTAQDKPQDNKQAAKVANKNTTSKTVKTVKTVKTAVKKVKA